MKAKPGAVGDTVRVTVKVPQGAEGAADLARLFRKVREGAILGDLKLSEWITQAILERRDRLVASGKWEGSDATGGFTERAEGCEGGDHRRGAGKGRRS